MSNHPSIPHSAQLSVQKPGLRKITSIICRKTNMYPTSEMKTTILKQNKTRTSVGWRWKFPCIFKSELVAGSPEKYLENRFTCSPSCMCSCLSCFEVCKMANISNQSSVSFPDRKTAVKERSHACFCGLGCDDDSSTKARGCLFWSLYVQSLFTVAIFFLSLSPFPPLVTYRNGHTHLTNGTCIRRERAWLNMLSAKAHEWMLVFTALMIGFR